jgi:hypothetical protein
MMPLQGNPIWRSYTPGTPASTGGTLGGSPTSVGSFAQANGLVYFDVTVSIPAVGTGTGSVAVSLPIAPSGGLATICQASGRENGVSGKMLLGIVSGANLLSISNYDATTPIANGASLHVSGWYKP